MPDLKISQLTSLASTAVASDDVLPIVDTSVTQTKKVSVTDLLNAPSLTSGPVVQQADIGTAPNEIPLNQYLGVLAYEDNAMVSVPASATSAGIKGQLAQDDSYLYVCIAANTWKRVAISTW